jgi:hypothetical protein
MTGSVGSGVCVMSHIGIIISISGDMLIPVKFGRGALAG